MNNRYICKGKTTYDKWVDGDLITFGGRCYIHPQNSDFEVKSGLARIVRVYKVIPETVGQCTGRKDKNGKLIFEGDVVKADRYIFFVKFGKCGGIANNENYGYMGFYLDGFDDTTKNFLRQGLRDDICYFTDVKVIGNIHDNTELLEVEE